MIMDFYCSVYDIRFLSYSGRLLLVSIFLFGAIKEILLIFVQRYPSTTVYFIVFFFKE